MVKQAIFYVKRVLLRSVSNSVLFNFSLDDIYLIDILETNSRKNG
ncbi:hypothetical protein ACVI3U_003387 [Sinorhizobium medicae]